MNSLSFISVLILLISTVYAVDEILFLDVQSESQRIGDAIVIHSGKKYAMIDVGYGKTSGDKAVSFNKVSQYLKHNNVTNIEWVLLTHNHPDHVGGIEDLLNLKVKNNKGKQVTLKVGAVYTKDYIGLDSDCGGDDKNYSSPGEYRKKRKSNWDTRKTNISKKTTLNIITKNKVPNLKLGNYQFKLYNTDQVFSNYGNSCANLCPKCTCNTIQGCNENTNSIIAVAKNSKVHYFFSGDIEKYPDDDAFKNVQNYNITYWVNEAKKDFKIDHFNVFKASHHGLKRNNGKAVYQNANPDICIISSKYVNNDVDIINKQNDVLNNIINGVKPKVPKIYYTGAGTVKLTQENNTIKYRKFADASGQITDCSKKNTGACKGSTCCFKYGDYCVTNKAKSFCY